MASALETVETKGRGRVNGKLSRCAYSKVVGKEAKGQRGQKRRASGRRRDWAPDAFRQAIDHARIAAVKQRMRNELAPGSMNSGTMLVTRRYMGVDDDTGD